MLFCCAACLYLFEAEERPEQCPDCGKNPVREADASEREEYRLREKEGENWK